MGLSRRREHPCLLKGSDPGSPISRQPDSTGDPVDGAGVFAYLTGAVRATIVVFVMVTSG